MSKESADSVRKGTREISPRKKPAPGAEKAAVWRQFADYSGLAIAMPLATVLGYAAGRWVDSAIGTSFFWLIGLLLGIAAGFLQLIRKAVRDSEKSFD